MTETRHAELMFEIDCFGHEPEKKRLVNPVNVLINIFKNSGSLIISSEVSCPHMVGEYKCSALYGKVGPTAQDYILPYCPYIFNYYIFGGKVKSKKAEWLLEEFVRKAL